MKFSLSFRMKDRIFLIPALSAIFSSIQNVTNSWLNKLLIREFIQPLQEYRKDWGAAESDGICHAAAGKEYMGRKEERKAQAGQGEIKEAASFGRISAQSYL